MPLSISTPVFFITASLKSYSLVKVARKAHVEIKWFSDSDAEVKCQAIYKKDKTKQYIIMSKVELSDMARDYKLDYNQVVIGILAHEIGHVIAYKGGLNFCNEDLAWTIGFSLIEKVYGSIHPDINKLSQVCLATYGDIKERSLFARKQYSLHVYNK